MGGEGEELAERNTVRNICGKKEICKYTKGKYTGLKINRGGKMEREAFKKEQFEKIIWRDSE